MRPFNLLALMALMVACPSSDDPLVPDNGGDADTDTDTDSDTDTDTDPDPTFFGSLTYLSTVNGVAECDFDVAIVGRAISPCTGCSWAYRLDNYVTEDRAADCGPPPLAQFYGLVEGDEVQDLRFAYAPTWVDPNSGESYSDALLAAFNYIEPNGAVTPVDFQPWALPARGDVVTVRGNEVSFELAYEYEGDDVSPDIFTLCDDVGVDVPGDEGAAPSGLTAIDDIACSGAADLYELILPTAGPVHVSVDTIATDTAFDPAFTINHEGCSIAFADDEFTCTFEPRAYECPAIELAELAAGTYTIAVFGYDSCVGDRGAYEITVAASAGATLALARDEVPVYDQLTLHVRGSAAQD